MTNDLRFPIGKVKPPETIDAAVRSKWIDDIAATPQLLRAAVHGLTDVQLDTPYREDGWTVRQVVHHIPDSHIHGYMRFRWALTEDAPVIKSYDVDAWADLADATSASVELSLAILDAVHARWIALCRTLKEGDFERSVILPKKGPWTIDRMLMIYAWHGRHHAAHITSLRERMAW